MGVPCAARIASLAVLPLVLAVATAVPVAGCYRPDAPYGAPCDADPDCPSGQTCDPQAKTCGPPSGEQIWRDDTADDFGAAGASSFGAAVEPAGFVGPIAYFAGGLRLTGIDHNAIPDASTPWNELAAAARAGTTFVRTAEIDFADATPLGVGLQKSDDITVLVEGEIYLSVPGQWRFELTADDIGFVEVAPPDSSSFQRIVTDQNTGTNGFYNVAVAGWHRIRGAFADRAGTMSYLLRYHPPGPGGNRTIPAVDLRAPAGDVAGLIVDGFEDPFLIGPRGSVLDPGTLGNLSLMADPFGLGVGNSSYSLRFAGQVLIDVAGSYAFRIDSSQGHRAWIDGASVADKFDTNPQVTRTAPLQLDAGWHDLVVDLNRSGAVTSQLDVTVASGPVWTGQPIPLDHLRPVVGRATRWAGVYSTTTTAIPDGATLSRGVTVDVQPDMVADRIDASFTISHSLLSTVEVKLVPPTGATATLVPLGSLTTTGTFSKHATMPPSTSGAGWTFQVTDSTADAATGNMTLAAVTILGSAGPAPFPKTYRYVSAAKELGEVASFSHVSWGLRQADPATMVAVSLRACDAVASCDDEPWTAVTDGAAPTLMPRRFGQYMVEVTGNGDLPTALDWIEIGYRTYDR